MKINKISVAILVVCTFFLTGCVGQRVGTNEGGGEENFSASLKELMSMGKTVECNWQFEDTESGGLTTGVVYVDGNRSRSEIRIRVEGEGAEMTNMDLISIADGEMGYMWNENQKTGSKYNIAEMERLGEEMDQDSQAESEMPGDWDEMYDYKCRNWRVDESKFVVPADVEFTDMMAQMQQMQEQTQNMKESMRGVCENLPEPQRSECLEAMQ